MNSDDSGYELTLKWVAFYGGELYGKTSSDEIDNAILNSEIYSKNTEQWLDGWTFSQKLFEDQNLWDLDLRSGIKEVTVPIYFFTGQHDYDTPFRLVEQYFDVLDAPKKEIIWFDNSAHFPFLEEPEKFNTMLVEKFLGLSSNNSNQTSDTLFDWAEGEYPEYFSPSKQSSKEFEQWYISSASLI